MTYKWENNQRLQMTAEEQAEHDTKVQLYNNTIVGVELNYLREKRNKLLAETDYLGASDQTMSSEMVTYREALRNLTNGLDTVEKILNVTFPTKPGV